MTIQQSYTRMFSDIFLWSVIGIGSVLALSACSSNDSAEDTSSVSEEPTETVVDEPVISETATPENDTQTMAVESTEPVVESVEVTADETEVLAADAGAKLYEAQCKVCHEKGLLDAPRYGDKAAWSTHIGKDRQTLYSHSAQGFNKMPAQAVNGVSEAQVRAAVDYMLEPVS